MCVLYLMEKSRSGEVAIGGRGCHREIVSTRRSRDQEIAPTGEVSGGGRDQEKVAIGRSLLHRLKKQSDGVSPTALSVSSN